MNHYWLHHWKIKNLKEPWSGRDQVARQLRWSEWGEPRATNRKGAASFLIELGTKKEKCRIQLSEQLPASSLCAWLELHILLIRSSFEAEAEMYRKCLSLSLLQKNCLHHMLRKLYVSRSESSQSYIEMQDSGNITTESSGLSHFSCDDCPKSWIHKVSVAHQEEIKEICLCASEALDDKRFVINYIVLVINCSEVITRHANSLADIVYSLETKTLWCSRKKLE